MQATCTPLDASQLLRDILQSKEKYKVQFSDSTNSSGSIKDIYTTDCSSEMISPLLHSKSSDMAFNDRDNDNDLDNDNENDGDIDVAMDSNSCINEESDDLDERSLDASTHEDNLKSSDHESGDGESKEAKRAHVDSILTGMRQPPLQGVMDSSVNVLTGDIKRQKRKQPQPQQHDSTNLHSEELAIQRQILQLQEQMQAVKRKREEDLSVNDEDDNVVDDDLTDGEGSKSPSSLNGESKRARVEHILSSIKSPAHLDNSFEFSNRVSPGSENGKKQKRKQTQPQQHDNGRSEHRDGSSNGKHAGNNSPRFTSRNDDGIANNEDRVSDANNASDLYRPDLHLNSFYTGLGSRSFMAPWSNGFDPQFHRDKFISHSLFGMRPNLDSVFRSKTGQVRPETTYLPEGQAKFPPVELSKITSALKVELTQAVNKAIDTVVSKVFNDKQAGIQNIQSLLTSDSNTPQQQQQNGHLQHQKSQSNQPQQPQKPQHSPNPFSHFLNQQHHQLQLQQQHHRHLHQQQQQHNPPSSQIPEREALKETVTNSQTEKKPEHLVSISDHQHFFQRLYPRFPHDKMNAFGPIHKSESELITPITGPSMSFHPQFPYLFPTQVLPPLYTVEPEQTEPLPLTVHNTHKKKRTKVTDIRVTTQRGKPALLQDNTTSSTMDHTDSQRHQALTFTHFFPPVLPTSVAVTNPTLSHPDHLVQRQRENSCSPQDRLRGSPGSVTESPHFINPMDFYDDDHCMTGDVIHGSSPGCGLMTTTLTPMHLRKAKLMFFYTRYPSSSILKMFFPDVMFNKNNTAQLVKWFSNFREFFYIQMEKYARQALAEGCKHPDDLVVTADSELFRHLNLHYNRNNQLEVPHNFMAAVQSALREFFKSIQSNKDAEPSWKKAIYKVIARMDESLPDFFKSPNWMEQLGDQ